MPTNIFCSDTLYVHTDFDRLPSFAEECTLSYLGHRIHTTKKTVDNEPSTSRLKEYKESKSEQVKSGDAEEADLLRHCTCTA